jgi:ABC-type nitrate/sulfonate/bicarbonate transport system substrate-binding protein
MNPQDSDARATDVAPGFNNAVPIEIIPKSNPTKKPLIPRFNRNRPLITGVVIVLLLVAGVLSWRASHKTPKAVPLTKVSVQLEWVNNPEFAGMYVAKDLGYYRAVGLDVTLKEFQDNTDVNQDVSSGKADYGVSTPLEVILARDKGQKTKATAAIYQTSAYSIVSPKSANIKTPADFKGKILGNSGGNNQANVTYPALIANAGLSPSQTTIKNVDFDVVKVFTEKQADTFDAYRTDQTYLLDKANISYNQIFPEQYGFGIYGDVLTASDAKIAQNPAQVRGFTQATLKGWQYAVDHQPETLAILARHANVLYQDSAYLKYDLAHTIPLIQPTGGQVLGSMQYVPWSRAYQAVQASGLLKDSLYVSDTYTSEFVK